MKFYIARYTDHTWATVKSLRAIAPTDICATCYEVIRIPYQDYCKIQRDERAELGWNEPNFIW